MVVGEVKPGREQTQRRRHRRLRLCGARGSGSEGGRCGGERGRGRGRGGRGDVNRQ